MCTTSVDRQVESIISPKSDSHAKKLKEFENVWSYSKQVEKFLLNVSKNNIRMGLDVGDGGGEVTWEKLLDVMSKESLLNDVCVQKSSESTLKRFIDQMTRVASEGDLNVLIKKIQRRYPGVSFVSFVPCDVGGRRGSSRRQSDGFDFATQRFMQGIDEINNVKGFYVQG